MKRPMIALALALLGGAALATPTPIGPAIHAFPLGQFGLVSLRDMLNTVANDGSVFGKNVGPAAVKAVLDARHVNDAALPLGVDALLVREPERTVLIDTGLGPKVGGALPRSLALAGVTPAQITDVLITHSHGDHVGGLMTATGSLAFPAATIRMSAAEWAYMRSLPANAAMIATIAPRVVTFAAGDQVMPGIRSVSLSGHTPGHVGYEITSGDQRMLDIGDIAHSDIVSLAHPEWIIGYDVDPAGGRDRRETELARLAASGERVFSPHFPFPGVGHVMKSGPAYVWRPDR